MSCSAARGGRVHPQKLVFKLREKLIAFLKRAYKFICTSPPAPRCVLSLAAAHVGACLPNALTTPVYCQPLAQVT